MFDMMLNRFIVNGVRNDSAPSGSISSAQIRAARALLNLEQETLWIDATYVKVRQNGRIVSVAVIVAVGVNSDGPA
jgi:hypothetical protein